MSKYVLVASLLASLFSTAPAQAAPRPNIVFVLMDDLRWDELGCAGHPFVRTPNIDRLAREGLLCSNAFATTPLCSPSRASFLTGQYAHTHGIIDNIDRSARSHELVTFPCLLQQAGYETAFIGKWHMGVDDSPRPGFDRWVSIKGQGDYIDPELNEDGRVTKARGYATDVFNQRAVEFLRRPRSKPFLLYLSHKAVHPNLVQAADGTISDPSTSRFIAAPRHEQLYTNEPLPRRPNAFVPPLDKPALARSIGKLPPLGRETATDDATMRNRLRMLMAAEEGVGQILDALHQTGKLDDTLVIFTSDHGYFYGEHGLSVERRLAYEEAIRIPLVMRYPKLIRPGSRLDDLVLAIDLAPTLLELGGAALPKNLHGHSLASALAGKSAPPRSSFLIEYFSDKVFPRMSQMGYQAVRTDRWKYIHYTDLTGADELYDLTADPYELKNSIAEPVSAQQVVKMQAELARLLRTSQ